MQGNGIFHLLCAKYNSILILYEMKYSMLVLYKMMIMRNSVIYQILTWLVPGEGGELKFSFGRDVPLGIWNWTNTNTNFPRKSDPFIYQSTWFWAKFWPKLPEFFQVFLNLSQFWVKFYKILKNWPIYIPYFHKIRGHWYIRRLITLPMLAARSHRVFCIEYGGGAVQRGGYLCRMDTWYNFGYFSFMYKVCMKENVMCTQEKLKCFSHVKKLCWTIDNGKFWTLFCGFMLHANLNWRIKCFVISEKFEWFLKDT